MPTKRENILEAILTRLKSVYSGAVRDHVRSLDSELPALLMFDTTEAGNTVKYGKQESTFQINVIYVKRLTTTENSSKIANEMIGQIIKYVISTDPTLSGAVSSIKYSSSEISYPELSGDWVIGVDVVFNVNYSTNLGDPYN